MTAAQLISEAVPGGIDGSPVPSLLFVFALAVLPFLLLSVTSFVKLSVVFGILRNALGAQQIPSAAITSLLCLVLTFHIMQPVAGEIAARVVPVFAKKTVPGHFVDQQLRELLSAGKDPLLAFLAAHSRGEERLFFLHHAASTSMAPKEAERSCLSGSDRHCLLDGEGFFSLIPAFVVSELRSAFAMGFVLYLPFLVIDLVVANLLVGVGLSMVSPVTVTLPLKILLFVGCDAWLLLCKSLVLSYGGG